MEFAASTDGTAIAYDRTGSGPPLVIVVGAFSDRSSKRSLTAALCARYEVYEYDRRGRGASGDGEAWSIEREVEDLAAVLAAAGQPAFVFGDSSGGALALEAAAAGAPIRATAVYEVPYTPGPSLQFADELDALIAADSADEATERFLALFTPAPVIAQISASPHWSHLTGYARLLPREVRLSNDGAVPAPRLAAITGPVLALAGADSPGQVRSAASTIAEAVPDGRAALLAGQTHAVDDAVLGEALAAFFTS